MPRPKRLLTIAVVLGLGMALAMPAAAQWKWKDKQGKTLYSDLPPPPGTADQDILQRPAGSGSGRAGAVAPVAPASAASAVPTVAPLAPRATEPELESRRKKAEQEIADKKKADDAKVAAARAENCARAKTYQRSLDSGIRIARTSASGEREILDDAGRAAEVKRTNDVIASECK